MRAVHQRLNWGRIIERIEFVSHKANFLSAREEEAGDVRLRENTPHAYVTHTHFSGSLTNRTVASPVSKTFGLYP